MIFYDAADLWHLSQLWYWLQTDVFFFGFLGGDGRRRCPFLWQPVTFRATCIRGRVTLWEIWCVSRVFPPSPPLLVWFAAKCCAVIAKTWAKILYLPTELSTHDNHFDGNPSDVCSNRFILQSSCIVMPNHMLCPLLISKNICNL